MKYACVMVSISNTGLCWGWSNFQDRNKQSYHNKNLDDDNDNEQ